MMETSLHTIRQITLVHSYLTDPLFTDPGLKTGIGARPGVQIKPTKCRQGMICQSTPPPPNSRTLGKHHHHQIARLLACLIDWCCLAQVVIDAQWLITVPPEAVKVISNSGQGLYY